MQTPRHRGNGRRPTAQFAPRPVSVRDTGVCTRYRCLYEVGVGRATDGDDAGVATGDLMGRARAGDSDAFEELTEPYRRELEVHCYRMLGSFQDAEDALQDTLLTAWQALARFEGRASIRTWLYRIATSR